MSTVCERRTLLVVDDEEAIRTLLVSFFEGKGYRTRSAGDGHEALRQISEVAPHLVVLDLRMPGMDGMEALGRIRKADPAMPVVVMTGHGAVDTAVAAMKLGAREFLTKPLQLADLLRAVETALASPTQDGAGSEGRGTPEITNAECRMPNAEPLAGSRGDKRADARSSTPDGGSAAQNPRSKAGTGSVPSASSLCDLMGTSPEIARVCEQVEQVAQTNLTVVLYGETGTGKSLVAEAIHRASRRAAGRLVRVDCGAIPDSLVESELFGHERGAFTGADRRNVGYFELADGGTLFLDEIANLSPAMMRKLLCALEDRKIYRVGGPEPIGVDIRVVAASNQDLHGLVEQGGFRRDLFHRLTEFVIELPPLRQRRGDIPFLVDRFIQLANAELGKSVEGATPEGMECLRHHEWPGNARELRNVVKRAVLLSDGAIEPKHVRAAGLGSTPLRDPQPQPLPLIPELAGGSPVAWSLKDITRECVRQLEQRVIGAVLDHTHGNKSQAARLLSVDYKTLFYKAKELGR